MANHGRTLPNVLLSTIFEKRANPANKTHGLNLADDLLDTARAAIMSTKTGDSMADLLVLAVFQQYLCDK
ncbi:MAG: hypothetical protein HGB19_06650 [Chlorobiales bacterium]|nr:hypothetical protein [Chlorobiales bacterium]